MKYILLSTDGPISLYEVPDKIAKNLCEYCIEFLKWAEHGPEAKRLTKGYFPEEEFIIYLNTVVHPNYIYKSKFIKTLDNSTADIPNEYSDLPYFNF